MQLSTGLCRSQNLIFQILNQNGNPKELNHTVHLLQISPMHLRSLDQVLQLLESQALIIKNFFINKIILPNIVFCISKVTLDNL